MANKITEEKYKQIKKQAQQAHKKLDIKKYNPQEKDNIVAKQIKELNLINPDEAEIFYGNCLIPDDVAFYNTYLSNGKIVKKSADAFNVTSKAVFTKVIEIGKYSSYLPELTKKGESMKEIEIIEEPTSLNVDEGAMQVIAKINTLMDTNKQKDKEIDEKNQSIEKLNNDLSNLKYINNDQNDRINQLELQNQKQDQINKENEMIIKKQEHDIKILLKYKENYEKIVGFLQKSEKDVENTYKK